MVTFAAIASRKAALTIFAGVIVLVATSSGPAVAGGFVFTVTRFDDPIPIAIPLCLQDNCSLREAVRAANAQPGHDTILLPGGTYTLALSGFGEDDGLTGDLDLTGDTTIEPIVSAVRATIDGGGLDAIFHIHSGAVVQMSGLTIRNGPTGVSNSGHLTLDLVNVEKPAGGFTSLISNSGTLVMTNGSLEGTPGPEGSRGIRNEGDVNLTNVTITGNRIGMVDFAGATAQLTNVTVTANYSIQEPVGGIPRGGIATNGTIQLKNTIVAGNNSADCILHPAQGQFISLGHNIDSDGTCNLNGPGDLPNANPELIPLADNGGPTLTHGLRSHSPAIDAADSGACPATDQRGVVRGNDGSNNGLPGCDIGAYEFQPHCGSDGAVYTSNDVPIPDNNPAGATSTVEFLAEGIITDLNVCLAVPHTWVGDLTATLEHEDTGTSVTLIDRPGLPATLGVAAAMIFLPFWMTAHHQPSSPSAPHQSQPSWAPSTQRILYPPSMGSQSTGAGPSQS